MRLPCGRLNYRGFADLDRKQPIGFVKSRKQLDIKSWKDGAEGSQPDC